MDYARKECVRIGFVHHQPSSRLSIMMTGHCCKETPYTVFPSSTMINTQLASSFLLSLFSRFVYFFKSVATPLSSKTQTSNVIRRNNDNHLRTLRVTDPVTTDDATDPKTQDFIVLSPLPHNLTPSRF